MGAENMSRDLQERAKSCESMEEIDALPGDDSRELADEELEGVAGGAAGEETAKFWCVDCMAAFVAPSAYQKYPCFFCQGSNTFRIRE